MLTTLRLVALAAVVGTSSAEICCAAHPMCPAGYEESQEPCAVSESNTQCTTVTLCCTTVNCRAVAEKCDKNTVAQTCTEKGFCYHPDKCNCGPYPVAGCPQDPCQFESCDAGYVCKSSSCGGCNYHCVAASLNIPTAVKTEAPTCTKYTVAETCTEKGFCYHPDKCNCGPYPVAGCPQDPCQFESCDAGYVCKSSSCGGCNYHCVAASLNIPTAVKTEAPTCTKYTVAETCTEKGFCYHPDKCNCGPYPVAGCPQDPCQFESCDAGYVCKSSSCGGCNYHCVAASLNIPTAVKTEAPTCNKYTVAETCTEKGFCYHPDKCNCGPYPVAGCPQDPCQFESCDAGYVCKSSSCGGCNYHCVAASLNIPTAVKTEAPTCTKYTVAETCTEKGFCYHPDKCNCGPYPVAGCPQDPCQFESCDAGYVCKSSSCGDCNYHCVAASLNIPTAVKTEAPTCTKYTVAETCTEKGFCYHPDKCNCGPYPVAGCPQDPCQFESCDAGYVCKSSSCGGCNYHCVAVLL